MAGQNTLPFLYAIPTAAIRAIGKIRKSGYSVGLSVLAKDPSAERSGDTQDLFWWRLWSSMPPGTSFAIPDVGPVLIAGPVSSLMGHVLSNAGIFGGINPLEACLHSIGVPTERLTACLAGVQANAILVLVHGPEQHVAAVADVLRYAWFEQAGSGLG